MQEGKKVLNQVLNALTDQDRDALLKLVQEIHHADLAEIFESLNEGDRIFFSETVGAEKFSDVITELPDTIVEDALSRFSTDEQREILDQVSDDDRVDLLQDVKSLAHFFAMAKILLGEE